MVRQYPSDSLAKVLRRDRAKIELALVVDRVQLTWLERMPRRWPAKVVGPA